MTNYLLRGTAASLLLALSSVAQAQSTGTDQTTFLQASSASAGADVAIPPTVFIADTDPNVEFGVGVPSVPEPGTWAMMGLGLAALIWRARRT